MCEFILSDGINDLWYRLRVYASWWDCFLGLIWGQITAPSQIKNESKLPRMVYIISDFLVLHFSENFMEIWSKIQKLQMHENLHKNVNENMFSYTFLCNFSWIFMLGNFKKQQKCYSFTLLISFMVFNPFKMAVQF